MTGGIHVQLNASPRTDGAGDTQLQSTLPTMSQASSTAPLTATKPLLLRAWLQAPFPPSSSMPCSLLLSSTLQIRSLRPAPVYTGKTRSRFIAALKKTKQNPPQNPKQPRVLSVSFSSKDEWLQRQNSHQVARVACICDGAVPQPCHYTSSIFTGVPGASPTPLRVAQK